MNHQNPAAVALGIDVIAEELNAALLAALMGDGAPALPYVRQLAKDIRRGRANPGKMIAAILLDAKLRGRPAGQRARLVDKLAALGLTSDADPAPTAPADMAPLHDAEEEAEMELDRAQMWQSREPHSIAARVAVEQAAARVVECTRALSDACTRSRYHDETVRRTARVRGGFAPRAA